MKATRTRPSSSGMWVVILLLGIGVSGGLIAMSWWTTRGEARTINPETDQDANALSTSNIDPEAKRELAHLEQRVELAIRNGKEQQVFESVAAFVSTYPDLPHGHNLLAMIQHRMGEVSSAYVSYLESLAKNPNQAEVQVLAGTLAMGLKRFGDAAGHYSQAVGMEPRNARYRLHLAQALIEQRQLERAKNILLEALAIDSDFHQAYAMLADVYARDGRMSLALGQIEKAIATVRDTDSQLRVTYLRRMSSYLMRDNRPEEAYQVLHGLSPTHKADPDVIEEMATCLWQLGKPKEAAALFEKAQLVDPNDWRLWAGAAWWNWKAGDRDTARRYMEGLRERNPMATVLEQLEPNLAEQR